ncbi:hypothetical protein ACF0H5_016848 [Mactra antiquata]
MQGLKHKLQTNRLTCLTNACRLNAYIDPTHRRPEVGHDTSILENNDYDLDMESQDNQNQTPETPATIQQTPSGTTSQNKSSTVVPDVSN